MIILQTKTWGHLTSLSLSLLNTPCQLNLLERQRDTNTQRMMVSKQIVLIFVVEYESTHIFSGHLKFSNSTFPYWKFCPFLIIHP